MIGAFSSTSDSASTSTCPRSSLSDTSPSDLQSVFTAASLSGDFSPRLSANNAKPKRSLRRGTDRRPTPWEHQRRTAAETSEHR